MIYDEAIVNQYLVAVNKSGYQISSSDQDYTIWLEYLDNQNIFNTNNFKDDNAGVALIRFYYEESKSCNPCNCYPNLLAEAAYGSQFYMQYIYNVGICT